MWLPVTTKVTTNVTLHPPDPPKHHIHLPHIASPTHRIRPICAAEADMATQPVWTGTNPFGGTVKKDLRNTLTTKHGNRHKLNTAANHASPLTFKLWFLADLIQCLLHVSIYMKVAC